MKNEVVGDQIITIDKPMSDEDTLPAAENYLLLDGQFMTWEAGLAYLQKTLNFGEEAANEFILSLPETKRIWKNETRTGPMKGLSHQDWYAQVLAEYQPSK